MAASGFQNFTQVINKNAKHDGNPLCSRYSFQAAMCFRSGVSPQTPARIFGGRCFVPNPPMRKLRPGGHSAMARAGSSPCGSVWSVRACSASDLRRGARRQMRCPRSGDVGKTLNLRAAESQSSPTHAGLGVASSSFAPAPWGRKMTGQLG